MPATHGLGTAVVPPRCRIPRGSGELVRRDRLGDLLDRGVAGPLTLVTGPPGSGKTTVVASWLRDRTPAGETVAWLSVDPAETGSAQFWSAVVEAAEAAGEPGLRPLLPRLELDRPGLPGAIASVLGALTTPLLLIVDDFHELAAREVPAQLDALLRHPLANLSVVIVSRADPALSLSRLRLAGHMTELRAADLAFTLNEAATLLELAGVVLTPQQLHALHARTEGWAAGLRLAALSLQSCDDPDDLVTTFAGDEHTVADYLVDEVLHRQPAAIREFMLRTSVVDVLTPDLADALTGRADASRLLDRLERSNAFVTRLDEGRGVYRYHRMFGELLRSQLRHRMPDLLVGQHRVAARWYARGGEPAHAVQHALAAGDCALAGDLLSASWPELVVRGESEVAAGLIGKLPHDLVSADPELSLAAASVELESGQGQGVLAAEHLASADARASEVKPKHRAAFAVRRVVAGVLRDEDRGEFEQVLSGADALLCGDGAAGLALAGQERRAFALLHKGIAEMWLGDDVSAHATLEEALALATHAGREYLTFGGLAALALLEAVSGAYGPASELGRRAVALASRRGWSGRMAAAEAWCALAVAADHRNDLGEAGGSLDALRAALGPTGDPALRLLAAITEARLAVRTNELELAQAALARARAAVRGRSVPVRLSVGLAALEGEAMLAAGRPADAREASATLVAGGRWAETELVWARVALATGDPRGAVHTLRAALDGGVAVASPSTAIGVRAVGAVAEHRCGHDEAALELVEEALALAEPQQDLAPFLAVGPGARELIIRRIRAGTAHRALAGELGELLDPRLQRQVDRRSTLALEPLSEREEVVLRYLSTSLSKAEIASEMLVSVNTVKTHMKNIYRKLDVTDRAQAVRRARTLRLV